MKGRNKKTDYRRGEEMTFKLNYGATGVWPGRKSILGRRNLYGKVLQVKERVASVIPQG